MDRKTLIFIIITIILLGVAGYLYIYKKTSAPTTTKTGTTFPSGSQPITGGYAGGGDTPVSEAPTFTPGAGATLPRLYELHKLPVAGVGFVETSKTTGPLSVRYIERGLGHIFETQLSNFVESRMVNETRSSIMEALWGNSGKSVVIRFIDEKGGTPTIKTSILNLGGSSSVTNGTPTTNFIKTEEIFLPNHISFMSVSEDNSDKLFYLENNAGTSVGATSNFKNIGNSTIFSSVFTEWLPQFPNQQLITLTTKPSATVPGHFFFIDQKTKAVSKIIGGVKGLTTLTNRTGKFVLFAGIENNVPELSVYDVSKKTARPLLLQTLPEKCAWGVKNTTLVYCAIPQALPNADYPDQWYQGLVTFADSIWEIDTTNGLSRKIMSPTNLGAPDLDIINPVLSSDEKYLLFMNKVSGTPWVYRIVETTPTSPTTINTQATTDTSVSNTSGKTTITPPPTEGLTKIN